MKSLAVWASSGYQNDELFRPESLMNRDNCLAPFHQLKTVFESAGWVCHTHDVYRRNEIEPSDVLFLDIPNQRAREMIAPWKSRVHVILQECEVVLSRNWDRTRHLEFDRVFTWHPDLIDNVKYRLTNFAINPNPQFGIQNFREKKLCTMISGNKASSHPLELYSSRVNAIRFFEQCHANDFDLYGVGWDQLPASNKIFRALNRLTPATAKLFAKKFSSYRGKVKSKAETLNRYRFAICFENAREIPGYITEKIFDCLVAGCVPIYWGAPDIGKHVPSDCYVDFESFKGFDELYRFMETYSEKDYENFLKATRAYLTSKQIEPYTPHFYANSIYQGLKDHA